MINRFSHIFFRQLEAEEEALRQQLEGVEIQKSQLDEQIANEMEKAQKLEEEADRSAKHKHYNY